MLRRGFKSQCEKRSSEIRKQFGLQATDPLSAYDLAKHSNIAVWDPSDIDDLKPSDLVQLTEQDKESWSAFTLRIREKHLIFVNPTQSQPRINSVVMHEMSHIILGHELASVGMTEDGHLMPSNYDQDQEDEANWLAGTLLLPRPALIKVRKSGLPDRQIQDTYEVSEQMLKWRIRMTGVDYQLANSRRG